MALIFTDPNPSGPFAGFQIKDVTCKVFKLTNTNFTTGGVNTLVGAIPATASIIGAYVWVKTQLAGGGVTAATVALGTASGGSQIAAAFTAFGAAGAFSTITPIVGLMAPYNVPYTTGDIQIWVAGVATTGNPTSGEVYIRVDYVN